MKKAIYPGCMVLARFQGYEIASRLVLEQLGYEVVDLDEFCCCGASLLPGVTESWINFTLYSLALAEKSGTDIITLCGNCTHNFKRANLYFKEYSGVRDKTESVLNKLGLTYGGSVKVQHFIEVLADRLADIQRLAACRINLNVAVTHPCQVLRPKTICGRNVALKEEKILQEILKRLSIHTVGYPEEDECCGATALLFDKALAIEQGRKKLSSARTHGADIMCAACGNCLFLLDRYQHEMFPNYPGQRMPVLSIAELIGYSFGLLQNSLLNGDRDCAAL